jgi:hypothetical protein
MQQQEKSDKRLQGHKNAIEHRTERMELQPSPPAVSPSPFEIG